jgi:hypothetical protein
MRVQALRHKRDAIDGAANADAWALHVAERSMLEVLDADAALQAARPEATPAALPGGSPAAGVDQRIADNVSEHETDSQDTALETWLGEQPWPQVSKGSGELDLYQTVREAIAKSRLARSRLANSPLAGRELPAKVPGGRIKAAMTMEKRHRPEAHCSASPNEFLSQSRPAGPPGRAGQRS